VQHVEREREREGERNPKIKKIVSFTRAQNCSSFPSFFLLKREANAR
jgi:hypothetical protein